MTPICAILRGSIDDYLSDALPPPQRNILREHLTACPACRDLAVARDPTLLFARPLPAEVPAEETRQILAAVRTGVSLMESERRIGHSRLRRRFAGVAAAAALAVLTVSLPGGSGRRPAPEATALPASLAGQTELQPAALPGDAEPPASEATIYDWNPGAGREEPRVVWIVDRGLDI